MKLPRLHPFEWIVLAAVMVLAAGLRFGWPGVQSFAFDEARLSLISLGMARGGDFASLGMPSSAGVPNLPGAAWLFALPYALSSDPLAASWFAGLLSLLGVLGLWALARHAWGPWAALAAALFLAASPYSVLYARSVWAQNLLPPLSVAWAGTAYLAIIANKRWALALHVLLAGFIVQVHFAGAALALGTVYLFVRFQWWRQLKPVLIGAALAALAFVPPLLAIAQNPDVAARFGSTLGSGAQVDFTAFSELVRLAPGAGWQYLAAGDMTPDFGSGSMAIAGLVIGVGLIGMVYIIWMRANPAHRSRVLLVELALVWLVVTPLFFLRHSTPVFIHYFLPSLPALALVAGVGTLLIARPLWRAGVTALVVVLAGIWSLQIGQSLSIAATTETPNGLSTPLGYSRAAAYGVPDNLPVLFFTHGDDPNVDGEAATFAALWWGREHRILNGDHLLILPPYPVFLMATLEPFQAWEEVRDANLTRDVQTFDRREGAQPFIGTAYDGEAFPDGFTLLDEPIALNDGARLDGWRVRRIGPRLRVSTLWTVENAPPFGTFQQFHHLRAAETPNGDPLMISDVPLSLHTWQVGDRVIVMGDFFDLPPAAYTVEVGHYTLPDLPRIPRADGGGDSVRLGPFEE